MIYLDNAATSCPKPPEVVAAISRALSDVCANSGRGAYELSLGASRSLLRTRRAVADLLNITDCSRVIFTLNATRALNMALKGLLMTNGTIDAASVARRPIKTHVVTSSLEHNAVSRPLEALRQRGVEITRVPCACDSTTDPADVLAAVRPDTALVEGGTGDGSESLYHPSRALNGLRPELPTLPVSRDLGRGLPS